MAKADKDLYAILGLAKGASPDEVRKAYRKLARKFHPDVNQGDKQAEERFKDLSLANDVLSDAKKRALYDEFGMEGLQAGFDPARAREYRSWADSGHGFSFRRGAGDDAGGGFDFGFEMPRGARRGGRAGDERGFADILNEMFGGGGGGGEESGHRGGQDIEHPIEIDLLDALARHPDRGHRAATYRVRDVPGYGTLGAPRLHDVRRQRDRRDHREAERADSGRRGRRLARAGRRQGWCRGERRQAG